MNTGELLAAPTLEQRVEAVKKHLNFSVEWKGPKTGIFEMRRHYTNYFKGLHHFKPYRTQLVEQEDHQAILDLLDEISVVFKKSFVH